MGDVLDMAKTPARKTRQRAVGVPDELWDNALTIARILDERDTIGDGLPVVVRRSLARYVARHRALLDPTAAEE